MTKLEIGIVIVGIVLWVIIKQMFEFDIIDVPPMVTFFRIVWAFLPSFLLIKFFMMCGATIEEIGLPQHIILGSLSFTSAYVLSFTVKPGEKSIEDNIREYRYHTKMANTAEKYGKMGTSSKVAADRALANIISKTGRDGDK